mgnify:CR=1 FL=1
MEIIDLFATKIFYKKCNLDLESLREKCYYHKENNYSVNKSGVNSYQGYNFNSEVLVKEIKSSLPKSPYNNAKSINISNMWININKPNTFNDIHNHDPFSGIALSGVFYVKVPCRSGNLKFYDPRGILCYAKDMEYYNNSNSWFTVHSKENLLIIFPSWLEHSVEPNMSSDDRISISFNIRLD